MKEDLLCTTQWPPHKMVPSPSANKLKALSSFSKPETMERLAGNVCCILIPFTSNVRNNQLEASGILNKIGGGRGRGGSPWGTDAGELGCVPFGSAWGGCGAFCTQFYRQPDARVFTLKTKGLLGADSSS